MTATFGQLLTAADRRFDETGGYKATAWIDAARVDLIHQAPDGSETVISSSELPEAVAPEDVAGDLLAAEIGKQDAAERYFVITLR